MSEATSVIVGDIPGLGGEPETLKLGQVSGKGLQPLPGAPPSSGEGAVELDEDSVLLTFPQRSEQGGSTGCPKKARVCMGGGRG